MGPRFKRNYVGAPGVPFSPVEHWPSPPGLNYLSNLQMADMQPARETGMDAHYLFWDPWPNLFRLEELRGLCRVQHIESSRRVPYHRATCTLSCRPDSLRADSSLRYGSVIDEVNDTQIKQVLCRAHPQGTDRDWRQGPRAYEKRAEAIRFEDEAQAILMKELTKAPEQGT